MRRTAAIYTRVSRDATGGGLAVDRQLEDCTRKAEALGWTVAGEYRDNDLSASKAVPRPEYDRLMRDLAAGVVDALVVYDLDRLTRKPAELESFIEFADKHSIELANVSGDVDLTSSNGRMLARIKGAVARQEADRVGERTKRQKQQAAEQGKPLNGRYRLFGYNAKRTDVINEEAARVKEAAAFILAGGTTGSLASKWNNEQVLTASGNRWTIQMFKRVLTNPVYAGHSTTRGVVVGEGQWPAIITDNDHEALKVVFEARRTTPREGKPKYLLSGLLYCALCQTKMHGSTTAYVCSTTNGGCGRTRRSRQRIDEHMLALMAALLEIKPATEAKPVDNTELDAVDEDLAALGQAQDAGAIRMVDYLARYNALQERKRALTTKAVSALAAPNISAKGFLASNVDMQRSTIAYLYPAIGVKQAGGHGKRFEPDQLVF